MDIAEIRTAKKECTNDITKQVAETISRFSSQTGINVTNIFINFASIYDANYNIVNTVVDADIDIDI